ncbi:MAG: CPBP family intramembrane metalloprotease [Bacteroidales bacterium]|nr:CPBP family intramembrane metalloprotease [Bacteroidales bacterium]
MKSQFKGWHRVLLIILPYVMIMGLFQMVGMVVAGSDFTDRNFNFSLWQDVIILFFTLAGTVLVIWFFRKFIDKEPFAEIGLSLKNRGKDIALGLLFGLIIMTLGYGILIMMGEIKFSNINFQPTELALSVVLFILVSFNEELFMRGYVLKNLMLSMNKYIALLISSLAFGAMHLLNPHFSLITFFVITLSGIILGLAYIYTKNLWFPISLHFSWNFFQGTIFGFNVSGQDDYSLIEQIRTQDNLINGGPFGFEGSLLSIGLLVIFTAITWKVFYKKEVVLASREVSDLTNIQ